MIKILSAFDCLHFLVFMSQANTASQIRMTIKFAF